MESIIGNINSSTHVITPERYLLNWIRQILKQGKKWVPHCLQTWHRKAPQLWIYIIQWVTRKDVQIKNIIFTTPTFTLWFNSCEYGIRGYNDKIMAWHWRRPPMWHGDLTLNLMKFLAPATSIYMTMQNLGQGSHILDFTDISSDLGCIKMYHLIQSMINPMTWLPYGWGGI